MHFLADRWFAGKDISLVSVRASFLDLFRVTNAPRTDRGATSCRLSYELIQRDHTPSGAEIMSEIVRGVNMSNVLKVLSVVMVLGLASGCLSYYGKREMNYNEPTKVSVKFETAEASRIFYSKLKACEGGKHADDPTSSASGVCVLFIVAGGSKTVYPNARYNALVDQMDINDDGTISVEEAKNHQ